MTAYAGEGHRQPLRIRHMVQAFVDAICRVEGRSERELTDIGDGEFHTGGVLARIPDHLARRIQPGDAIPAPPNFFGELTGPAAYVEHRRALSHPRKQQALDDGSDFDAVVRPPVPVIKPGE